MDGRSAAAFGSVLALCCAASALAQIAPHGPPIANDPIPSGALRASLALPPYIAAAVADPGRPATDRARDIDRHPAEVTAFAGIRPGVAISTCTLR